MVNLNVNPTRIELMRLKTRLKTTTRGHKLLKDRADEMIRQFMIFIHKNKELRESLEIEITETLRAFAISQTLMTPQETESAIALPSCRIEINAGYQSVMGIDVPKLSIVSGDNRELYPYSFSSTVSELDNSIVKTTAILPKLIELAEIEKTCDIIAVEIEKVRRRVNALEQYVIPQIRQEMRRITMKLDENERSNLVRLMKVKDLISSDDQQK